MRYIHDGKASYEEWRGVFTSLPSSRYLSELKRYFPASEGIDETVLDAWRARALADGNALHCWAMHGALVFDALTVKGDFEVDPATGNPTGMPTNMCPSVIQAALDALNAEVLNDEATAEVKLVPATHWLEFYFVGFGKEHNYTFSVCKVATGSIGADDIFAHVERVTVALWMFGFDVVLTVADGAIENMNYEKAAAVLRASDFGLATAGDVANDISIAWRHPVTEEPIFVAADVVHVLKSDCNALEKSGEGPNTTRLFTRTVEGTVYTATLEELELVWRASSMQRTEEGSITVGALRLLTKEHFRKTPWTRMRVNLAAQVLSSKMAAAVRPRNPFLANYCQMNNDLLDLFNQRRGKGGVVIPNVASPTDETLAELLRILKWHREWRAEVYAREEGVVPEYYLHEKTHFNLSIAIMGFVGMCKYYLASGRVGEGKSVPTKRCLQDLLEHHFRNVRGAGRDNTNPTVLDCRRASRCSTIVRILRGGNSSSAPAMAEAEQPAIFPGQVNKKKRVTTPAREQKGGRGAKRQQNA